MKKKNLHKLHKILLKKKLTISVAESCTGGLLSKTLTDLSGASVFFYGGVVTYSNSSKNKVLKIDSKTIKKFGVISEETACKMAKSCKKLFGTKISIAVTGVAGPSKQEEKPVGLVYVTYDFPLGVISEKLLYKGTRSDIRNKIVNHIITHLYRFITVQK